MYPEEQYDVHLQSFSAENDRHPTTSVTMGFSKGDPGPGQDRRDVRETPGESQQLP